MFNLIVCDSSAVFYVDVCHNALVVARLPWEGGEFSHGGREYVLRGPYHELADYTVYELKPLVCEIRATTESTPSPIIPIKA